MSNVLENKYAIVTGASSGLGFSMAKALAKAGATVALASRPGQKLDKAAHIFIENELNGFAFPIDVRSEESIEEAYHWVENEWGRLDILVNNAGVGMRTVNPEFMTNPQPFYKVTAEGFRNLIDTNLTGYFLMSRAFAPLLMKHRGSKIINISMNHSTMKRKGFVPYGPSRAATESLTHIMAEDLKDDGVDVNMLLPGGATETGMIPEEHKEAVKKKIELLSPDVMTKPTIFLASEKSDGITGERIKANEFDQWIKEKSIDIGDLF